MRGIAPSSEREGSIWSFIASTVSVLLTCEADGLAALAIVGRGAASERLDASGIHTAISPGSRFAFAK